MFSTARALLSRRLQNWARRRQGPDENKIRLGQRRIYILPTRQGALYALTLLVMLLGSMNYSNSMGFLFTFLLGGLALVGMHACHANLVDVEIAAGRCAPVFAGDTAYFHMQICNPGRSARTGITLSAESGDTVVTGDLAPGEHGTAAVPLKAVKRGWLVLGRLTVETRYPLGLFRAWSWLYMDLKLLVYPRPAASAPPLPLPQGGRGRGQPSREGDEDFNGLRLYRPGDAPQHIAWKAAARQEELLVKQFAGSGEAARWLDWNALPALGTETRLAVLCRWVIECHAGGLHYGLRLPGVEIAPSGGDAHRDRCLQVLALFGLPA